MLNEYKLYIMHITMSHENINFSRCSGLQPSFSKWLGGRIFELQDVGVTRVHHRIRLQ